MSEPTNSPPTTDHLASRRLTVFERSRQQLSLAIVVINEMLEQAKLPALVSWEFTPHEPTDLTPEELWLNLRLDHVSVAIQA